MKKNTDELKKELTSAPDLSRFLSENEENFIDYKSYLIFSVFFGLTWKFKIHPILMIVLAGVAGLLLY